MAGYKRRADIKAIAHPKQVGSVELMAQFLTLVFRYLIEVACPSRKPKRVIKMVGEHKALGNSQTLLFGKYLGLSAFQTKEQSGKKQKV